eukprot:SAG31_NODE_34494_length_332_cov_0.888412_2_plen_40_part_01
MLNGTMKHNTQVCEWKERMELEDDVHYKVQQSRALFLNAA